MYTHFFLLFLCKLLQKALIEGMLRNNFQNEPYNKFGSKRISYLCSAFIRGFQYLSTNNYSLLDDFYG